MYNKSCSTLPSVSRKRFAFIRTGCCGPTRAGALGFTRPPFSFPPVPQISISGTNYTHHPLTHSFSAPHPEAWLFFNSELFPACRLMIMNCELIGIGEVVARCNGAPVERTSGTGSSASEHSCWRTLRGNLVLREERIGWFTPRMPRINNHKPRNNLQMKTKFYLLFF
jgi:hypothetical protein